MSGADVLDLISAIISIVDGVLQVYDAVKDVTGLPTAFREVAARLPLIQDTLRTATDGLEKDEKEGGNNNDDDDDDDDKDNATLRSSQSLFATRSCLLSCQDKVQRLEALFREVIGSADASGARRVVRAIRATNKSEKVRALEQHIMEDLQVLTASHIVRAATRAQMTEALDRLGALQARSTAGTGTTGDIGGLEEQTHDSSGGVPAIVARNRGSGTQMNFAGTGDQNYSGGPQLQGVFHGPFHVTSSGSEKRW